MSEMLFHPIAYALVFILAAIIALCALTERRGAKPFDPWRK